MKPGFTLHATALLAATLGCATAFAQDRAVERTHFELGLSSIDSDTSDSTSSGTLGLDLIATVPLGRYFGASLGGTYSQSSIRSRDVLPDSPDATAGSRQSCNFDNTGGDISLFFRRPEYGRIGLTYGIGNLSADCEGEAVFPLGNGSEMDVDYSRVDAEYYLGNFTLGASFTATSLENSNEDLESTELTLSWYPLDSLKVSLSGNDLYDDNTYGLKVEHQPEMLGDVCSVWLGYSTTDASPRARTIQIGLAYYFGREATLKARDRQYR